MNERATDGTILLYIDTNVLSWIARGEARNVFPTFQKHGWRPVLSDVTLDELTMGSPQAELAILDREDFLYLLAHEAVFVNELSNFYNSLPPSSDTEQPQTLEIFLTALLRAISGSKTVPDLSELLRSNLSEKAYPSEAGFSTC